jgi:mRNA interferase MazF
VVPLTRTVRLADPPGNLLLLAEDTGLPSDSVADVSQIVTIDQDMLRAPVGQLAVWHRAPVLDGIDLVPGRQYSAAPGQCRQPEGAPASARAKGRTAGSRVRGNDSKPKTGFPAGFNAT